MATPKRLPVALQLYSVREQLKEDFRRVVRQVSEMGYDGIQFAGYGGLSDIARWYIGGILEHAPRCSPSPIRA